MNQLASIKALGFDHPILGAESRRRYVAIGGTYKHRLTLLSLGWTWNTKHKVWVHDGIRHAGDEALQFVRKKRAIQVVELWVHVEKKNQPRQAYADE